MSYFENPYKKPSRDASEMMACYTVRFTFKLPSSFEVGSWHYLAYCYPYTYSDLQNDLTSMLSLDPRAEREVDDPGKTLSGLDCPLLTITSFAEKKKAYRRRVRSVHPGESNASWMMRGFLRFMLSDDPVAASLRSAYVFKVVPMLNADGVVIGNYRCNLASHDLNRQWAWPKSDSSPTILGLKRLISECRGDVRCTATSTATRGQRMCLSTAATSASKRYQSQCPTPRSTCGKTAPASTTSCPRIPISRYLTSCTTCAPTFRFASAALKCKSRRVALDESSPGRICKCLRVSPSKRRSAAPPSTAACTFPPSTSKTLESVSRELSIRSRIPRAAHGLSGRDAS